MKTAAGFRGLWVPFLIVAAASVFSLGFLFHYHNSQVRSGHELTLAATRLLAEIEIVTSRVMSGVLMGSLPDYGQAGRASVQVIDRIGQVNELCRLPPEASVLLENYLALLQELGHVVASAQELRTDEAAEALARVRQRQQKMQRLVDVIIGQAEALRDRQERNLNFFLLLTALFLLGVALFNGFFIIPALVVRPMETIARELEEQVREARNLAVQAEAANKSKTEFLANMSHELRTPLNGILGMNSLLLDSPLSEAQRHAVEVVQGSGEMLLALLDDILDFAKIEAGKLRLENKVFSLLDLVRESLGVLRPKAESKGLVLVWEPPLDVPEHLEGDATRLRQILFNLVGNAIKFTEQGEIRVRARVQEQDGETCLLYFSVQDSGIGIPAEKLPLLFKRFSQVDASISRRFGGSGLGLAIAKELSERMGGAIGVSSEEGKGSLFWFTVRMKIVQGEAVRAAHNSTTSAQSVAEVREVLLVEDNPTNQLVATQLLKNLGVKVHLASNGEEALQRQAELRCRLIFMDVQMPVLDGLETTKRLRQQEKEKKFPPAVIVAMTAHAMEGDRQRCLAAGMDDYITKPITRQSLEKCLQHWWPLAQPQP